MKTKLIYPKITENFGENLLKLRGIKDVEEFCNPTDEVLEPWQKLDTLYICASYFLKILKDKEKPYIGLIQDADCDGLTSAAIMYQYVKLVKPEAVIEVYIHEGKQHGLSDCYDALLKKDFDMLIVPDAGTNDGEYIKDFSCPVFVIDHHLKDKDSIIPQNMLLINNQTSPEYDNKQLTGAGMTYQFCRAVDYYNNSDFASQFIDLAALGICGDMGSGLEVENQYFWRKGFKNIKNYFFKTLIDKRSFSMGGEVNPISVAFYIVPMINALIRVGTKEEKQRLFMAMVNGHALVESNKRGEKGIKVAVAQESARECVNAKTHQDKQKEEIVEQLEAQIFKYDLLENQILFIRLDDSIQFPPELNGLIANQLANKYKKPTIVARLNDYDEIKGSARGVNASALTSFKKYLESTGLMDLAAGHDQSFGVEIKNSNLEKLHRIANKELIQYELGETYYEVDFEFQANDSKLVNLIYDLENYKFVWSQNNSTPKIHVTDLHFTKDDYDVVGKNKDTLRIHKNGITFIKFFAKDLIEEFNSHEKFKCEIVGESSVNEWRGNRSPQILINAIDVKEDSILEF